MDRQPPPMEEPQTAAASQEDVNCVTVIPGDHLTDIPDATCDSALTRSDERHSVSMALNVAVCSETVSLPSVTLTDCTRGTTTTLVDNQHHSEPQEDNSEKPVAEESSLKSEETRSPKSSSPSPENAVANAAVQSSQPSPSSRTASEPSTGVHDVKWISFNKAQVPIVTQNQNGPCPLISVVNLLALRSQFVFPPDTVSVTDAQLMEIVADCIIQSAPKELAQRPDYQKNMNDALSVLSNLITGLDVNVRFTGVFDFEYTPECIIFDLLNIPLCHGWLADPEDVVTSYAVGGRSYNQLVEKIIAGKASADLNETSEALAANEFLEQNASQLTYHGIAELNRNVSEGQFVVFFRNNHFSTMLKREGELFILVTDQGFLKETDIVWETLNNVEGDSHFVDSRFQTVTKKTTSGNGEQGPSTATDKQIDTDYMLALSLQEECSIEQSDRELAMKLQKEEDEAASVRSKEIVSNAATQQRHAESTLDNGAKRPGSTSKV